MTTDFRKRLFHEMKERGMNQTEFAEFVGVPQQNMQRWLVKGVIPRARRELMRKLKISKKEMDELCARSAAQRQLIRRPRDQKKKDMVPRKGKKAGTSHGNVIDVEFREVASLPPPLQAARNTPATEPNAVGHVPFRSGKLPMPIYGYAAGSPDGKIIIDGAAIDWVSCPIELENVENAYGVFVDGNSMEERYRHGWRLNVNPNYTDHSPRDGVVVQVVEKQSGNLVGYIKEFVAKTPKELIVKRYNPPKELRFDLADVAAIHRVVGTVEI